MNNYRNKKSNKGFKDFVKDLKAGYLKPVILIYGEEQYLAEWAVKAVKRKFVNEATEVMDYAVVDEEQELTGLLESLRTLPLMSEKRVVWIRNFEPLTGKKTSGFTSDLQNQLISYIEDPSEDSIAIFSSEKTDGKIKLVKSLKKYAGVYEFGQLTQAELESFASKRFKAAGLSCGRQCMNMLISETGYFNKESKYRLYSFANDLRKIIALSEGGSVTPTAIEYAVNGDRDSFIFDLLDGISGNNKAEAFQMMSDRLKGNPNEAMPLIGSIVSQMELMYQIREFEDPDSSRPMRSPAQIHDYTGLNEYRVKKAMGYANRYSLSKLKQMLLSIYDVNRQIVTGELPAELALELFIAQI